MSGELLFGASDKYQRSTLALLNTITRHYPDATIVETQGEGYAEYVLKSEMASAIIKNTLSADYLDDSSSKFRINPNVLSKSIAFRNGILAGLSRGKSGWKIGKLMDQYTFTLELNEFINTQDIAMIASSVGKLAYVDGNEVRIYNKPYLLKELVNNGYFWSTVVSVDEVEEQLRYAYCLEVLSAKDDKEEVFNIANGIVTHNCRLRLDKRELLKRSGGLFGSGDSTGSIGVVTLNLPLIAYESGGSVTEFYRILTEQLVIAKDSLEIKREWLQKNILEGGMIPAYQEYVGTFKNHFSTIGVVGMNEMCQNYYGDKSIGIMSDRGNQFALEVSDFIRNVITGFQEETGNLYNYEATPAESTSHRLALKSVELTDGDIIVSGTREVPYFTNSCHLPVKDMYGINQVLRHQEAHQEKFTGGTVVHLYTDNYISASLAKHIIRTACENYKIPYIDLSPLIRTCAEHGFVQFGAKDDNGVEVCEMCGSKLKLQQRITGYIREIDNFNNGKRQEFSERNQLLSNQPIGGI
jgi:hypothetical protein